eukprot:SAG31_NODE_36019_length_317_cov_0.935780_2_plen_58_part_01
MYCYLSDTQSLAGFQVKLELQHVLVEGASWRAELEYFGRSIDSTVTQSQASQSFDDSD